MCTIKNYRFIISALGSAYINDYEKYTKETSYLLNYLSEINFDYRRIVFFYTLLNNKNTPFIVNKQYHCRQRAPIENAWSTSGYFKAVFLKKTQIIIVSIYKYTVYIMF